MLPGLRISAQTLEYPFHWQPPYILAVRIARIAQFELYLLSGFPDVVAIPESGCL